MHTHALAPELRAAQRATLAKLIREALGVVASKWSVGVLLALGEGTRRYHELLHELEPISEKVLTQTLRTMERDGLIARHVHPEVPPRVEYALTPLGSTLAGPLKALGTWSVNHADRVEIARAAYDARVSGAAAERYKRAADARHQAAHSLAASRRNHI